MTGLPTQDKNEALRFLGMLDPGETRFHFTTLDDDKSRSSPTLIWDFFGTLEDAWPEIVARQQRGAGAFVVVNRTDGAGRRGHDNIASVRAVWHDDDAGTRPTFPLRPDIVVESSPGKLHSYWLVDGLTVPEARGALSALVKQYGGDPGAQGVNRVLRLPGTLHLKNAAHPHAVRIAGGTLSEPLGVLDAGHPRAKLLAAFPPQGEPVKPAAVAGPVDTRRVMSALGAIPADDRKAWHDVGRALYRGMGEAGRGLWDAWAESSEKFDEAGQDKAWKSFGAERDGGIGLGTLFHYAGQHGWQGAPRGPAQDLIGDVQLPAIAAPLVKLRFPEDIDLDAALARHANQLIKGILGADETAVLYGASGTGKTFLAIELAYAIARGVDWHGHPVKQGAVLYVALEGTGGFKLRVKAAENGYGNAGKFFAQLEENVSLIREPPGGEGVARIVEGYRQLVAICGAVRGLIVIDTVSQAIAGDDENATEVMASFVKNRVAAIRDATGASVLVIHHANKSGLMRGNAALGNDTDVRLKAAIEQDGRRVLSAEKIRDGETGELFGYSLESRKLGIDPEGAVVTSCVIGPAVRPSMSKDEAKAQRTKDALADWIFANLHGSMSLTELATAAMKSGALGPVGSNGAYKASQKLLVGAPPLERAGRRVAVRKLHGHGYAISIESCEN